MIAQSEIIGFRAPEIGARIIASTFSRRQGNRTEKTTRRETPILSKIPVDPVEENPVGGIRDFAELYYVIGEDVG